MRENKLFKIIIFLLLSLFFACYVWLRLENSQNIHEPRSSFGDVHEYFEVASQPITSSSFWIAIRPPVIPLIYKFLGSNEINISRFQLWFSIFSWLFLALAVMGTSRSYIVKVVAFVTVLAFSLSQDVIMWDYLILSESIAISFMIVFLFLLSGKRF